MGVLYLTFLISFLGGVYSLLEDHFLDLSASEIKTEQCTLPEYLFGELDKNSCMPPQLDHQKRGHMPSALCYYFNKSQCAFLTFSNHYDS